MSRAQCGLDSGAQCRHELIVRPYDTLSSVALDGRHQAGRRGHPKIRLEEDVLEALQRPLIDSPRTATPTSVSARSLMRAQIDRRGPSVARPNSLATSAQSGPSAPDPFGAQSDDEQHVDPPECPEPGRRAGQHGSVHLADAKTGVRGSHSRDAFTTSRAAPPVVRTSYSPAGRAGVSTGPPPGGKRSRSESGVVVPAPNHHHRDHTVGDRAAPPANRITFPDECVREHGRPQVSTLAGQPVEDAAPERCVGVGARAASEVPPPQSARRHDDDSPTSARAAHDRDPAIEPTGATNLDSLPIPGGAVASTSTGARLSQATPASAAVKGDGGAPVAYHSSSDGVDGGTMSPSDPRVARRGGPKMPVSPCTMTTGAADTAWRTSASLTGASVPSTRHCPGATRKNPRVGSAKAPRSTLRA